MQGSASMRNTQLTLLVPSLLVAGPWVELEVPRSERLVQQNAMWMARRGDPPDCPHRAHCSGAHSMPCIQVWVQCLDAFATALCSVPLALQGNTAKGGGDTAEAALGQASWGAEEWPGPWDGLRVKVAAGLIGRDV